MGTKVKDVAERMYIDGSEHMGMLEMFGRELDDLTIRLKKIYLRHIIQDIGDMDLEELSSKKVVTILSGKKKCGGWKNTYIGLIGEIYEQFMWEKEIPVANRICLPKFYYKPKQKTILSSENIRKLFSKSNGWKNETVKLLCFMCLCCGLRSGEARGVRRKQIDFEKGILYVDGFIKNNGNRTNYNKGGREIEGGKVRAVVMPEILIEELKDYLGVRKVENDDYVFITKKGKTISAKLINRTLKKEVDSCHIEKHITAHSLRYTYITRMRRYADVDVVRIMAGHTNKSMTDYYTIIESPEMLLTMEKARDAANKILDIN